MRFFLLLLLAMPLMAQDNIVWTSSWPQGWSECETGQFLAKNGKCLPDAQRTAANSKCPAMQYATAYQTCETEPHVKPSAPGIIPAYCHWWGKYIWCDDSPALFGDGWTWADPSPKVIYDAPWPAGSAQGSLEVYSSVGEKLLLECQMPTQTTAKNCKLADGVTLDGVMTAIAQAEWQASNQLQKSVDAANQRTQQCVDIAEKLIGHSSTESRKKKGGK